MKIIPIALATHQAGRATALVDFLLITRTDLQVFAFTSHNADITIGAQLYAAGPGLDISSIVTSAGLNVDNLALTTLDDGSVFSRDEVLAGVWRNATFRIDRGNWASPSDGLEEMLSGTIGECTLKRASLVFELRGKQQKLQQPIGNVSTKTCRAHFADFPSANGTNFCRLVPATYTTTGTITSRVSNQLFTASALAGVTDYYTEGIVTFTSGDNAGLSQKVKAHTTGGILTLSLPMLLTVQVGDTFSIIAGCRHRFEEDCRDKFSNVLNFQGEPHRPTVDRLTAAPEVSA